MREVLHPNKPLFAVGLVSGHVQAFRLPIAKAQKANGSISSSSSSGGNVYPEAARTADTSNGHPASRPRKSSLSSRRSSSGSPSLEGYGTIETIWRTRRHKGCCRALAFSNDGSTLFSAGTDGLVKAASAETGRVIGKVALPQFEPSARNDSPSVLLALNASNLVLGTDTGVVHVYELRQSKHLASSSGPLERSSESRNTISSCLTLSANPTKSYRPHRTADDPAFAEAIYSITALPPSKTSTSGESRTFVTTAADMLAVCDLHKGVVACSTAQGEELPSLLCCSQSYPAKDEETSVGSAGEDTIVVGQSNGTVTLWKRGSWGDRMSSIKVHQEGTTNSRMGLWPDDTSVDCLAVSGARVEKDDAGENSAAQAPLVAAGLGNGLVKFVRIGSNNRPNLLLDTVVHEDPSIDGVVFVGFDLEGRLITAGGTIVKVWHPKALGERRSLDFVDSESFDAKVGSIAHDETPNGHTEKALKRGFSEDDEEQDSEEERPQKRRKKHKRSVKRNKDGRSNGILAFKGLE
ncbi:MAG: WD repeat-containing protein jip5 [Alyxoria varia]|nr:MAG: WD repeat-containing protein jip5 [Alyxoria varia]